MTTGLLSTHWCLGQALMGPGCASSLLGETGPGFWWQGPGVQNLVLACPWMGLKTKESWIWLALAAGERACSQVAGVSRTSHSSQHAGDKHPLPIDLGLPRYGAD